MDSFNHGFDHSMFDQKVRIIILSTVFRWPEANTIVCVRSHMIGAQARCMAEIDGRRARRDMLQGVLTVTVFCDWMLRLQPPDEVRYF